MLQKRVSVVYFYRIFEVGLSFLSLENLVCDHVYLVGGKDEAGQCIVGGDRFGVERLWFIFIGV